MRTLIKNAAAVTPLGARAGANILIEDGIIKEISDSCHVAEHIIDAEGGWVLPGFIDLHCHGGGGYELMDASPDEIGKIADFHLAHGTTAMLATTLAASDAETLSALDNISGYMSSHPHSPIVGIHLEGPHLNASECGAQDPASIHPISEAQLRAIKEKYPEVLRVSAAPEVEGGMELGRLGAALGIIMSVAHTDADFATVERAHEAGYSLMTHLYSGMKGVTRKDSFRIAGAVEAGLYLDGMFVELIADGCHLPEELLRFVYKIKGADRICLITDAIRAAGMRDGSRTKIGSLKSGLDVIVEDGVAKLPDRQSFAGSCATADRLFKAMMAATDGDIVAVSKMASTTPARLMGLTDRGEIAEGKRADLVIMDGECNVKRVLLNGEEI